MNFRTQIKAKAWKVLHALPGAQPASGVFNMWEVLTISQDHRTKIQAL